MRTGVIEDETAAHEARVRYRARGIEGLEPDDEIRPLLTPGEQLVAVRHAARLDRRQPRSDPRAGLPGDLYVTSVRIVHLGAGPISFELDEIQEAALADERLLLIMRDGTCVVLAVDQPHLLRTQIAAARAAARQRCPETSHAMSGETLDAGTTDTERHGVGIDIEGR